MVGASGCVSVCGARVCLKEGCGGVCACGGVL